MGSIIMSKEEQIKLHRAFLSDMTIAMLNNRLSYLLYNFGSPCCILNPGANTIATFFYKYPDHVQKEIDILEEQKESYIKGAYPQISKVQNR